VILLDTQVLIWLVLGSERLGRQARTDLDNALAQSGIWVSAITFWEIAMLEQKNRIRMGMDLSTWRQELLNSGLNEHPLDGATGILATQLSGLNSDPTDRMIAATALQTGAILMTADTDLLSWNAGLTRQDARI
jgi:PIN domain nuclease of toxin-antitoxin system